MNASSSPSVGLPTPERTPANHVLLAPGATAKIRSPLAVAVFTVITLGIYGIFWWYYINREMADYGRARGTKELGDDPSMSTLALFPGGLVVVPAIWTAVTTFQRVQAGQRLTGQVPLLGWVAVVLAVLFSPAFCAYMQSGLNSAWHTAGSAPSQQEAPVG
jgi:hypothetical protein